MPGKYYPKELKEEIINKINSEGITALRQPNATELMLTISIGGFHQG